jgi:AcrR family transcriptional regulator
VGDPALVEQVLAHRSRPSLIERRKAALRMDIARNAVRLFLAGGVGATTGDDIADAVGISTRTLWRHFPTKESCARPLLAACLDAVVEHLRRWPADTGLLDFAAGAFRAGGLPGVEPAVLDLVRLTGTEPALRAVWLQAHDDALPVLAALLAERAGTTPEDLRVRVHAATLNGALRSAVEDLAHRRGTDRAGLDPAGPAGLDPAGLDRTAVEVGASLRDALRAAAEGLPY